MEKKAMQVAVAMSGGVDSSMAAAFLQEQGYNIFGITMNLGINSASDPSIDAKVVADFLKIPHYCVDLQKEFRAEVIEYFIAEYQRGRTPNPCVVCNPQIKFAALFDAACSLGATHLATGHYVRVVEGEGKIFLAAGVDQTKDQSYFLSRLSAKQLAASVFPLGELTKNEIRQKALQMEMPVAQKQDSQEICFIPDDDYRLAIRTWSSTSHGMIPGDFVDESGKVIGKHQGIVNYTLGQRKGLGLALGYPAYVVAINAQNNQVVVGTDEGLFAKAAQVEQALWNLPKHLQDLPMFQCQVKIRSAAKKVQCRCILAGSGQATIEFFEPVRAVTPGQAAAFYLDDLLIGGAFFY